MLRQPDADSGAKSDGNCNRSAKSDGDGHRRSKSDGDRDCCAEPNRHCNRSAKSNTDGNGCAQPNPDANNSAKSHAEPDAGAGLLALDQSFVRDRRAQWWQCHLHGHDHANGRVRIGAHDVCKRSSFRSNRNVFAEPRERFVHDPHSHRLAVGGEGKLSVHSHGNRWHDHAHGKRDARLQVTDSRRPENSSAGAVISAPALLATVTA